MIDRLQGPDWYGAFKDLNAGLILDAAGQKKEAGKRLEAAVKFDPTAVRSVDAYARWASRNASTATAIEAYQAFEKVVPRHPLIQAALADLKEGKPLPLLIKTPQEGAAEVLYGLGAALARQGGEDLALVYLQVALWLYPDHPLAGLTLADLYEQMKQPEKAIEVYLKVPDSSPLKANAEVPARGQSRRHRQVRRGAQAPDRPHQGESEGSGGPRGARRHRARAQDVHRLRQHLRPRPSTSCPIPSAARGRCSISAASATNAAKNWTPAEADLKKALQLYPDQPHVLNYLGYSWVDQGVNLQEGLDMIRKAVSLRPDDGYIVDSLGWAYYRLGRYEDAVKELERAVELKPQDPVINDHLGDAYWKVGRKLEATFQWTHAKDLKPEPEDLVKITKKLQGGLDAADAQPAVKEAEPAVKQASDQKGG